MADRGSRLVLFGAYGIALLALVWPAPPAPVLPDWVRWCGAGIAMAGVWMRWRRRGRDIPDLAICGGLSAAAGSLVALITVTVALLARRV